MRYRGRLATRLFQRSASESFLYAFGCAEFIKVGISDNPADRLADLQTANPHPVTLLKTWKIAKAVREVIERDVHELLRSRRVRLEWFRVNIDEVQAAVSWATHIRSSTSGNPELARCIPRPLTFINGELDGSAPASLATEALS